MNEIIKIAIQFKKLNQNVREIRTKLRKEILTDFLDCIVHLLLVLKQRILFFKITILKLHKITGNEPSAIFSNSHSYIGISSWGPVDKL